MTVTVRDDPGRRRFEVVLDGTVAGFAAYDLDGERITFTHTSVDDAFSGQGLASRLVDEALEQVAARGLRVVPLCPFVRDRIAGDPDRWLRLVPEEVRREQGLP